VGGVIVGQFFNISSEDLVIITGIFDDMLTTFGVPCKIVYKNTETTCPNCILNPRTGISMNKYKAGGPVPFIAGDTCPVCNGAGKIPGTETFDIITMSIDWEPKPWASIGGENSNLIRIPSGMVSTRGFIKDLPKVIRGDYCILDINDQYITNEYKLYGSPYVLGAITNNRYFIAVWKRIE
jgi:hypothetical protein